MEDFFPELYHPLKIPDAQVALKKLAEDDKMSISSEDDDDDDMTGSEDDTSSSSDLEESTSGETDGSSERRMILTNLDAYSSSFALPEMDQIIVRVTKILKPRKKQKEEEVEIQTGQGKLHKIQMSRKWKEFIRPGTYLLLQPPVQESNLECEIVKVIDPAYNRFYDLNGVWPDIFLDIDFIEQSIQEKKNEKDEKKKKKEKKRKNPEDMRANVFGNPDTELMNSASVPTNEIKKEKKKKKKELKETNSQKLRKRIEMVNKPFSQEDAKKGITEEQFEKKRQKLLKIILEPLGTDLLQTFPSSLRITPTSTSTRTPIVQNVDDMPPVLGDFQPWDAILTKKYMNKKQKKKYIAKELKKLRNKIRKETKIKAYLKTKDDDVDLPCGVVKGQILTMFEDFVGKYKISRSEKMRHEREQTKKDKKKEIEKAKLKKDEDEYSD